MCSPIRFTRPGAVAIPLYIYVHHEYQLNYAGWIDRGFSPFGDERYGIDFPMFAKVQTKPGIGYIAGEMEIDDPTRLRGIALSHLVNSYVKSFLGELSVTCGCAMAAGIPMRPASPPPPTSIAIWAWRASRWSS